MSEFAGNRSITRLADPKELEAYRNRLLPQVDPDGPKIVVCCGPGCQPNGSIEVAAAIKACLLETEWKGKVLPLMKKTGCHGLCSRGPLVVIEPRHIFYQKVLPRDVPEIIEKTVLKGELIERLLYTEPETGRTFATVGEIPFYARQTRIVLKNVGHIDPFEIDDAIMQGAYSALARTLTQMQPDRIIKEVKVSGLRGRGGAGFPTGIKWESCASQAGERYIICNADEGDAGAFMDRAVMEGDPHSVLEGMAIAARALGSQRGFIYVRLEYPLAATILNHGIRQAEAAGLLGDNILGAGFNFKETVSRGAGAYICGESSAIMSSLEGKVGRPRPKYIRSVERGFRDSPSCLNNVETFANIPSIVLNGGAWYKALGTEESGGTKVFSLSGFIRNTGLVEVPMGTPLREIVYDIGGGIPKKREFKAVQTGGPSGGCIPSHLMDTPIEYESLAKIGSIMGSGGMIIMDENTCMVEMARFFTHFLIDESCGQCTPCREGLIRMNDILTRITTGRGQEEDIGTLEELGKFMAAFSLCGLGASAGSPVLSTIRYFKREYEIHIHQKKCPAGFCKPLFSLVIDQKECTGCGKCRVKCPASAIVGENSKPHAIQPHLCVKCKECYNLCEYRSVMII